MAKILQGDFQGGHPAKLGGVKKVPQGYRGAGTRAFRWAGPMANAKFDGQRPPMPEGYKGRVLYGGRSRTGRKEGTGPQS